MSSYTEEFRFVDKNGTLEGPPCTLLRPTPRILNLIYDYMGGNANKICYVVIGRSPQISKTP